MPAGNLHSSFFEVVLNKLVLKTAQGYQVLGTLILSLLCSFAFTASLVAASATSLSEWRGEYFKKKEGAFYLVLDTVGFEGQAGQFSSRVQIKLVNLLSKKIFTLAQRPIAKQSQGAQVRQWKLPSGKYALRQIKLVDGLGKKRLWQARRGRTFIVKRVMLSNLGRWTLAPKGKAGLRLRIRHEANTYEEAGASADSSLAAVINGFNGLTQKVYGGKKVLQAAEDDYSTENELRATFTTRRNIAMVFQLNLFKHNYLAKQVATILSVHDPQLRTCYTDRLRFNDALRGEVGFTFLLSKSTGSMTKLKHTGGTLRDPKLVQCLYYELAAIQFPINTTMIGEINYTFEVR